MIPAQTGGRRSKCGTGTVQWRRRRRVWEWNARVTAGGVAGGCGAGCDVHRRPAPSPRSCPCVARLRQPHTHRQRADGTVRGSEHNGRCPALRRRPVPARGDTYAALWWGGDAAARESRERGHCAAADSSRREHRAARHKPHDAVRAADGSGPTAAAYVDGRLRNGAAVARARGPKRRRDACGKAGGLSSSVTERGRGRAESQRREIHASATPMLRWRRRPYRASAPPSRRYYSALLAGGAVAYAAPAAASPHLFPPRSPQRLAPRTRLVMASGHTNAGASTAADDAPSPGASSVSVASPAAHSRPPPDTCNEPECVGGVVRDQRSRWPAPEVWTADTRCSRLTMSFTASAVDSDSGGRATPPLADTRCTRVPSATMSAGGDDRVSTAMQPTCAALGEDGGAPHVGAARR